MACLKMIMAYICKCYPLRDELSKARLNKMIYLADWKFAIENQSQISNIDWVYNNYGPYVDDIEYVAKTDDWFEMINTCNCYGNKKTIIGLTRDILDEELQLYETEKNCLNHVIQTTRSLNWTSFINLVYSTYPIISSTKKDNLNLVQIALQYNRIKSKETHINNRGLKIHEEEALDEVERLLENAKWDYESKKVIIEDGVNFKNFITLRDFLIEEATNIGCSCAPIENGEFVFNNDYTNLVDEFLNNQYRENLSNLGWNEYFL